MLREQPGHAFALKIVRERNVELLWFVGGNRGRKGVEDHEHTGVEGKRHGAGFAGVSLGLGGEDELQARKLGLIRNGIRRRVGRGPGGLYICKRAKRAVTRALDRLTGR